MLIKYNNCLIKIQNDKQGFFRFLFSNLQIVIISIFYIKHKYKICTFTIKYKYDPDKVTYNSGIFLIEINKETYYRSYSLDTNNKKIKKIYNSIGRYIIKINNYFKNY